MTGQYDSPDYTTSAVKRVVRELRSQLNDSSVARLADLRTNALYQLIGGAGFEPAAFPRPKRGAIDQTMRPAI